MRGDSVNAKSYRGGISNDHKRVLDSLSMMQWDIMRQILRLSRPGSGCAAWGDQSGFATAVARSRRRTCAVYGRNPLDDEWAQPQSKFRLLDPIDEREAK